MDTNTSNSTTKRSHKEAFGSSGSSVQGTIDQSDPDTFQPNKAFSAKVRIFGINTPTTARGITIGEIYNFIKAQHPVVRVAQAWIDANDLLWIHEAKVWNSVSSASNENFINVAFRYRPGSDSVFIAGEQLIDSGIGGGSRSCVRYRWPKDHIAFPYFSTSDAEDRIVVNIQGVTDNASCDVELAFSIRGREPVGFVEANLMKFCGLKSPFMFNESYEKKKLDEKLEKMRLKKELQSLNPAK